jgi:hypothetical protein
VSIGAGAAALGGGAAFGVLARQAADDAKKATDRSDLPGWRAARSRMEQRAMIADGLFVTGAVGVGVGAVLLLRHAPVALSLERTPGGGLALFTGRLP